MNRQESSISATVSQKCVSEPNRLVSTLSFSHQREIMTVDNPFERFFYETECMKCTMATICQSGFCCVHERVSKMVEYALSGMDNQLFVSTYMLHLPEKKQLEDFLLKSMEEMGL